MKIKEINRLVEALIEKPFSDYTLPNEFKIGDKLYSWWTYILNNKKTLAIDLRPVGDHMHTHSFQFNITDEQHARLQERYHEINEYFANKALNDICGE